MIIIAETIKGINVVIGADTTGLSKALSDVNKRSRDIQSELKQVEKLLKLDPTNTDLLAQKQKLLSDAVANTSNKLNSLKAAQEQVNAQFAKGDISEGQYRAFQREVAKTEQELNGFKGKLSEVSGEAQKHSAIIDKLGKDYKESFDQAQQSMGNSFEQMKKVGAGITAAGAGIATGLGIAVKGASDFEQGMANVYSVMAPDEVSKFKGELKDLAITMGADTKYSATEAAKGIEELVKAGVSVKDVMGGGLSGALSLATAGELELADAAEIASTALNAFKKDHLTVKKAADILAGAANASATSVAEMKFGLSQVSSVASGVGLSFKDTATALAVFAQNGLKGSDAGTSLKTMLLNLQPSTKAQFEEFADLGIMVYENTAAMKLLKDNGIKPLGTDTDTLTKQVQQLAADLSGTKVGSAKANKEYLKLAQSAGVLHSSFYDANGSLRSMDEIAGVLRESLNGMSDAARQAALRTMFGTDAIRAGNILYKEGAKGINDMAAAMDKISAADVAAQKMDTLKGTIEQLKGSVETAQISLGSALLPAIRKVAEIIQKLVDGFNKLSPKTQSFIATSAAIAAALALIIGPLTLIVGFIPQIVAGLSMLTTPIVALGASVGTIGAAIAAAAVVVGVLYAKWDDIMKLSTPLKVTILALLAPFTMMVLAIKAVVAAFENWDQITAYLNGLLDTVKGWANSVGEFFTKTIPDAISAMITWFKELPGKIGQALTDAYNGVVKWISQMAQNIQEGIPKLIQSIETFFSELPGKIGKALGLALGTLTKWGIDGYNYVVTQVPKIIESIGNFFAQLPGKIGAFLLNALNNIKTWGTNVGSWITSTVPTLINNIGNFFAQLPGKILTHLTGAYNKVMDWGSSVASWASTEVPKIVSNIVSFFAALPKKMVDVGKQLITGLWDGIKGSASWLKDKISDFADGIISGFKSAFDIHSPSRVMKDEVGKMIGLGMAQGIQSTVGNVKAAMNTLNGQVAVSPVLVGASGTIASSGGSTPNSFADMFRGATFNVRSDSDIDAIGKSIANNMFKVQRSTGGVR